MRTTTAALLCGLALPAIADVSGPTRAADDFWHPPVTSAEVIDVGPVAVRRTVGLVRSQAAAEEIREAFERLYGPRVATVARGRDGEALIVLALDDQVFGSLQRARAALAQLNLDAPTAPLKLREDADARRAYAALRDAGFRSLTLSDGVTWAHRVEFR
jgi:hypothetical protein